MRVLLASAFLIQLAAAHSTLDKQALTVVLSEHEDPTTATIEAATTAPEVKVSSEHEGPTATTAGPAEVKVLSAQSADPAPGKGVSGNAKFNFEDVAPEQMQNLKMMGEIMALAMFLHVNWVYIVVGIAVSVLFWTLAWLCFCLNRNRSVADPAVKKEDMTGDFAPVGLGSCFYSVMNCFEATFCHACMWAETASKIRWLGCGLPLWIIVVYILVSLEFFTFGLSLLLFAFCRGCMRMSLRESKQQGESKCCADCCVQILCCPCAIHQEAEFVEDYESIHGPIEKVSSAPA